MPRGLRPLRRLVGPQEERAIDGRQLPFIHTHPAATRSAAAANAAAPTRRRPPDRRRRWAWGAAATQPGGLAYVDETTLAYLCGPNVVLYQPDTKTQRFVAGGGEGRVTAFAACPARRLLALAQRGAGAEGKATITLFDLQTLKRRKILTAPGEGIKARAACGRCSRRGACRRVGSKALHCRRSAAQADSS